MNALPIVVRREHRGDFRIRLVFSDGVRGDDRFFGMAHGPVFNRSRIASTSRVFLEGGTGRLPKRCRHRRLRHCTKRAKANAAAYMPISCRPVPSASCVRTLLAGPVRAYRRR